MRPAAGLLDTSVFIADEDGRRLDASQLPERSAVSAITLGELWAGVLAAPSTEIRERRLRTATQVATMAVVPVDGEVAQAWAGLRVRLRDTGRRLRANDSWIAATAIALQVPLITQDHDFDDLPGLEVVVV